MEAFAADARDILLRAMEGEHSFLPPDRILIWKNLSRGR